MGLFRRRRKSRNDKGQGLIEAAVVLPFLFLLLFNAINFAYYFYVALNLAQAPRDAVEYSIQGFQTVASLDLPSATTVSTVTYANLTGLPSASNTPTQVCTAANGVDSTTHKAACTKFPAGSAISWAIDADPDQPGKFVLNRVDVQYTVQPLIAGSPFGIKLLPSLTFHRQVSMRAID
jgi:Flp pilus assembly protein TadG